MESQRLRVRNVSDEKGIPTGGSVEGVGINIRWQDGPLGKAHGNVPTCAPTPYFEACIEAERPGHNGAFVGGVIEAAIYRLEFFQKSRFACKENAEALKHLRLAKVALDARTTRRIAAGTEGTHKGA